MAERVDPHIDQFSLTGQLDMTEADLREDDRGYYSASLANGLEEIGYSHRAVAYWFSVGELLAGKRFQGLSDSIDQISRGMR